MKRRLMLWLLNRLKEPSTWASIATALTLFGFKIDDSIWNAIVNFGAASAALAGVLLREKPELPPIDLVARPEPKRMHGMDVSADRDHQSPDRSDYPWRGDWNG